MISIIVPVYNSKKYIERCVKSILAQKYPDIEVILVDDGSKDGSPLICEELARSDTRIKVIHKENGGISSARNVGIEAARGEWITFCDNDDVVGPNWLERLYNYAVSLRDNVVLPVCSFSRDNKFISAEDKEREYEVSGLESDHLYDADSYLDFYTKRIGGFVWNALFKRDIIEKYKIRFPERKSLGDINEDLIFDLLYLPHVDKVVYTGYIDYLWSKNESNHSVETAHKFYFEKYEEKLRLWFNYIEASDTANKDEQLGKIATFHLYEVVLMISQAPTFESLKKYVRNKTIQKCLRLADTSNEDYKIIWLIKHQCPLILWLLFKIYRK